MQAAVLPRQSWRSPRGIEVRHGALRYDVAASEAAGGEGVADDQLLSRFQQLADEPDAAIGKFARDYGVLGLCQHGYPEAQPHATGPRRAWCDGEPVEAEPLDIWRAWSRRSRHLVEGASRLVGGRPLTTDQWSTAWTIGLGHWEHAIRPTAELALNEVTPNDFSVASVPAVAADWVPAPSESQAVICMAVTNWLRHGQAHLGLTWNRTRRPSIVIGTSRPSRGVFGAVGVAIAQSCADVDRLAECHECKTLFLPTRRQRSGQRVFCLECRRDGAPQRWADRDRRARSRLARGKAGS